MPALAQALVERGTLDGLISGISSTFVYVGNEITNHPYVLIVLAIVLVLLLRKRK